MRDDHFKAYASRMSYAADACACAFMFAAFIVLAVVGLRLDALTSMGP
jgi:hypothetical protein